MRNDRLGHGRIILDAVESAISSVQPKNLVRKKISFEGSKFRIRDLGLALDLGKFDCIFVVGGGKASGGLAQALEASMPKQVGLRGIVNVLEGTSGKYGTDKIELLEAGHPIPDENGEKATRKMVSLLEAATPNSLVFCLISGGGSAMMALPAAELTLEDKIASTKVLLNSGAGIEEVNCVRKHLSRIKGGQLVRYCNGALVVSLIISDIIGNPLASIASGPTTPDPTSFADSLKILSRYDMDRRVPNRAFDYLTKGAAGLIGETPKPGDPIFSRVTNYILGDNVEACNAAAEVVKKTKKNRYTVVRLGSFWHGEARDLGENIAGLCRAVSSGRSGVRRPAALIWGGEATVTVRGTGKGGRNQEEGLAALNFLQGNSGITMAFFGTDGVDGFTEAAGVLVHSESKDQFQKEQIDPEKYLANNDSNSFFQLLKGSLIFTGPTGTNVNDMGIALIE